MGFFHTIFLSEIFTPAVFSTACRWLAGKIPAGRRVVLSLKAPRGVDYIGKWPPLCPGPEIFDEDLKNPLAV